MASFLSRKHTGQCIAPFEVLEALIFTELTMKSVMTGISQLFSYHNCTYIPYRNKVHSITNCEN